MPLFRKQPRPEKPAIPPFDLRYRVTFNDGTFEEIDCHALFVHDNNTTTFREISDYFWSDGDSWTIYERGWHPRYQYTIKTFSTTGYRSIEKI